MMWGPLPFSGSKWKISLALKDPKLLVSDFASNAEFPHTTVPEVKLEILGGKAFKINRNWSYEVKKAGSHFLLSIRFWM